MAAGDPTRAWEFGPFRYDPAQRLLFRGAEPVALPPKAIDTLHVLLERRGQVVEKANLMRLVWPDCTVEDVGLARNISILRKALGDDQEQFIATIPRRGYRFAPAAGSVDNRPSAVESETHAAANAGVRGDDGEQARLPRRRLRQWLIAVLACAAVAVLIYWQFYLPSRYLPGGADVADVAVLPIECLSPELDRVSFCRGFTEVLGGEIAKLGSVHVIAASTVHRYEQFNIPAPVMARMLRLDATVEGAAQLLGSRVRISLRLKDVHSGKLIWADNFDRDAGDLGRDQEDVAREAAGQIRLRLSPMMPSTAASH